MPTSPTPAFRIGERVADPLQMYLADVFTVSANLAGLPAISVPCGFTADRPADRPAADRPAVRRSDAAARRRRLRARHRMVETAAADPEPLKPADWTTLSDEKLLEVRMCDLGLTIAGTELEPRIAEINAELDARGLALPAALLPVRRVVHAGRRAGHRDSVLPRASAAREARARADAGGRRRRSRVVPADPAPRSRPRHRQRLPAAAPPDAAAAVRRSRRPNTPSTTRRSRTARASCSISITGTRRAIPTKTSPRPSPSGSIRSRCGRRATRAGRRSASSNTWTG